MKRFILFISLCACAAGMVAQNAIFSKYRMMDEVRYVFVSHAMLEAMAENQEVKVGSYSLNQIRDAISSVLIIRTTSPNVIQQMEQDFAALRQDSHYQLLLEKGSNTQTSTSLFCTNANADNEFVLFEKSAYLGLFIIFTGQFTASQFTQLIE